MNARRATGADLPAIRTLWEEFTAEVPEPDFLAETWEEEGLERRVAEGTVLVAELGEGIVGFAEVELHSQRLGWLHTIYVRPEARRQGVASMLLRGVTALVRDHGAGHLGLEVGLSNEIARAVYERLGFRQVAVDLAISLDDLDARLVSQAAGRSTGRVYVQTDDEGSVERAARQYVPRLGRSERTQVLPPYNGWTAVDDELCGRDPRLLRRLARELSDRTGAVVLSLGVEEGAVVRYVLFERGSVADEYASLPEYHGPLPPGDVVALNANPTVVARLTGADPARVRTVARTASSPAELPPPGELRDALVQVLGVEPPAETLGSPS